MYCSFKTLWDSWTPQQRLLSENGETLEQRWTLTGVVSLAGLLQKHFDNNLKHGRPPLGSLKVSDHDSKRLGKNGMNPYLNHLELELGSCEPNRTKKR